MKPKCIEHRNGTKIWRLNGKRHREDGPAIEYTDGSKAWVLNNKLHREDGPAYEGSDGTKKWWLNDKEYTEQEYYKELYNRGIITEEELVLELI